MTLRPTRGASTGAAILVLTALLGASSTQASAGPIATLAPSANLVDRAVAAGINWPSTPSWDLSVVDYDNDGDSDFSMSLHMRNAGELRRNNGDGTFTRIATGSSATTIMPRPSPQGGLVDRHSCAWADFDDNGLQDAYCAAGRYASNRYKDESINNELFRQTSMGVFNDTATASGVGEPCTRGRHVAALDVNGDGWQDLFLGAQAPRNDASDRCNSEADAPYNEQSKVFINQGPNAQGVWQGFRPGREWNVSQANTGNRLALPWDYNNDGRMDLLTATYAMRAAFLYRNTGTGFQEVARSGAVRLPLFNRASLADLTGDGVLDLVYADDTGFAYRAGTRTATGIGGISGTTVRIGTVPSGGVGWGAAVGDVNGDGEPDVYGLVASANNTGNPADYVFVSNDTTPPSWQRHEVPPAGGDANDVIPVTVNQRSQFVVLNGGNDEGETPGPVQLIAWSGP